MQQLFGGVAGEAFDVFDKVRLIVVIMIEFAFEKELLLVGIYGLVVLLKAYNAREVFSAGSNALVKLGVDPARGVAG